MCIQDERYYQAHTVVKAVYKAVTAEQIGTSLGYRLDKLLNAIDVTEALAQALRDDLRELKKKESSND